MKRFLAGALLTLVACVKTGTVAETQPFTANLANYQSASIEVDVPGTVENSGDVQKDFVAAIGDSLNDKKVFASLPPIGGDMTVKVTVTALDGGSRAMAAFTNGGDAEVKASVQLVDTKQKTVVGAFDVTGNSKTNGKTTVGGMNTKAMGSMTNTALEKAADQIAGYLDAHRAGHGGT